ncbi:MAG: hypothetical protein JXM70_28285, partial [Pirellulales bacterium]|nr:hypothetical protein [Pirellulales bacterium]
MSSVRKTRKHRPFKNLFVATPDEQSPHFELHTPDEQPSPDERHTFDEKPARRSTRLWKWLAGLAILLVVVVWLAPVLIAHSPMMGWIVSSASSDLDGSVEVGSASLGWFSPITLSQIEVRDSQGQTVISIPQVEGDRSLMSLALDRSHLGKFRLEKPQLSVVLDDKGTNIQRLIAKYLEPSDKESSTVGVVIVDGTVTIEDRTGGRKAGDKWKIEGLNLEFDKPDGGDMTLAAKGSMPDGRQASRFDVALTMPAAADATNSLTAETVSLPLEKFAGLLAALAPQSGLAETELSGRLDAKIQCKWPNGDSAEGTSISVDTAVKNLRVAGPPLSGDRVELENLLAVGDLTWTQNGFSLETASVKCDLGSVALKGNLRVDSTDTASSKASNKTTATIESLGVLAPYARQSFKLEGDVDLARLANMLPNTLHIHKQTRVTSGKLKVSLSSGKGPKGMVWKGHIETSDLTAMRRG